jgi:hypothetical protein
MKLVPGGVALLLSIAASGQAVARSAGEIVKCTWAHGGPTNYRIRPGSWERWSEEKHVWRRQPCDFGMMEDALKPYAKCAMVVTDKSYSWTLKSTHGFYDPAGKRAYSSFEASINIDRKSGRAMIIGGLTGRPGGVGPRPFSPGVCLVSPAEPVSTRVQASHTGT